MPSQPLITSPQTDSSHHPLSHAQHNVKPHLCDKCASSSALVPPSRGENGDALVVAGQTVDTGFDENEAELAVLVLAVALEVLSDGDGLR